MDSAYNYWNKIIISLVSVIHAGNSVIQIYGWTKKWRFPSIFSSQRGKNYQETFIFWDTMCVLNNELIWNMQ